jgi:hypothetical protein
MAPQRIRTLSLTVSRPSWYVAGRFSIDPLKTDKAAAPIEEFMSVNTAGVCQQEIS